MHPVGVGPGELSQQRVRHRDDVCEQVAAHAPRCSRAVLLERWRPVNITGAHFLFGEPRSPPEGIDSVVAARFEHGVNHLAAWHSRLLSTPTDVAPRLPKHDPALARQAAHAHKLMVWLPKALMKTFDPRKKFFADCGPTYNALPCSQ